MAKLSFLCLALVSGYSPLRLLFFGPELAINSCAYVRAHGAALPLAVMLW